MALRIAQGKTFERNNMSKRKTPLKAIRAKCIDCSARQLAEVRSCIVENCPIWLYRMGKRPKYFNGPIQQALACTESTQIREYADE